MFSVDFHKKVYYYVLIAIAITLPFHYKLNSVFLLLLFLNWMLEGNFKSKFIQAFSSRYFILSFVFYAMYLLQLLFTTNYGAGWFSVEKKSSFLILPLIIFSKKELFDSYRLKFFYFFTYATTSAILVCIFFAYKNYLNDGNINHFLYHDLANNVGQSAIYLSLLCILALIQLLLKEKPESTHLYQLEIVLTIILIVSIFLLASKTHIIFTSFMLVFIYVKTFFQNKYVLILGFIIFCASFWSLFNTNNVIEKRFTDVKFDNLKQLNKSQFSDSIYFDGLSFRLLMLKFGKEIIHENNALLLGVSPGNSQDILNKKMLDYKMYSGNKNTNSNGYLSYNYHNQYAETCVSTGVIGLTMLILLIGHIFSISIKEKDLLIFLSILVFAVAFVTESMLERQVGVVSFCLFFSLFIKKV
jgi:hypothetical protein